VSDHPFCIPTSRSSTRPPETPTWGGIIAAGQVYLSQAWWISLFPGAAVILSVLALNLVGDGLRDFVDRASATPRDTLLGRGVAFDEFSHDLRLLIDHVMPTVLDDLGRDGCPSMCS
jgi:hypothetical protein